MSAKCLDQQGRWRNKVVAFRMSPEEDELLETAVRLSGLTKQDYIIRRLQEKEVTVTGNPRVYKALKNELAKVLDELKRLKKGDDVPEDLLEVIRLITMTMEGMKEARLVVLDPIQGFLGAEVDMHRANEIRPLMKRVAVLAEKYHCAIILIGHMNKNSNGKSSYRGLGSIDFQAAARSVLIVGRIKDEPEVRVVCHVKSSLAPEGKSIAFRLDKDNGFEWIGEYDISADDLLSGDSRGQKSRKAKEFLLEILADGGMAQKKIEEEAEKRGIKKKTLRNAKLELEIDSVKRGNQWFWMLSE